MIGDFYKNINAKSLRNEPALTSFAAKITNQQVILHFSLYVWHPIFLPRVPSPSFSWFYLHWSDWCLLLFYRVSELFWDFSWVSSIDFDQWSSLRKFNLLFLLAMMKDWVAVTVSWNGGVGLSLLNIANMPFFMLFVQLMHSFL